MKIEKLLKNKDTAFLSWDEPEFYTDEYGEPKSINIIKSAIVSDCITLQRSHKKVFYENEIDEVVLTDFILNNWAWEDKSKERYEFVRRLNARQFADIFKENISTGTHFDDIIDREINKIKKQKLAIDS
jgi:hypothetical protein